MNRSSTLRYVTRVSPRVLSAPLVVLALVALAACGGSGSSKPTNSPSAASSVIDSARCASNKDAGTITYLTGYNYQASASILEVLAAQDLGYYNDVCLTVKIEPGTGDTAQNDQLLAAGTATVSAIAQQDLIQANLNGQKITGISSYSDAGLDVLMTMPDVTDLRALDGKTLGFKGYMPIALQAMLEKAGVDFKSLKIVKVGYDPSVLPRGKVQALTGFVSNEPLLLEAAGTKPTVWQPSTYGIASSLGAFAVNPAFAAANPEAVQDFLRATFHAYVYCSLPANVDACIAIQHKYAGADDDATHEKGVWTTETGVVAANPLPGGFGSIDENNIAELADLISTYGGQKVDAATAQSFFDPSFAEAIAPNGQVQWPND